MKMAKAKTKGQAIKILPCLFSINIHIMPINNYVVPLSAYNVWLSYFQKKVLKQSKNILIKKTKEATNIRHKNMWCKTISLKLSDNKMSKTTKYYLNRLFLEAKWFENSIIQDISTRLNDTYAKNKSISIKYNHNIELRNLYMLSSQMKQGIVTKIKSSLMTLHTTKLNGKKVGRLKFKKSVNSIILKQHNNTYTINTYNNTLSLQGFPNTLHFTCNSLKQLPTQPHEFTSAKLIRDSIGNFYVNITMYVEKQNNTEVSNSSDVKNHNQHDKVIGIDFGIKNQLTLSNGISFKYQTPITTKLKRLQRALAKKYEVNKKKQKSLNEEHNYDKILTTKNKHVNSKNMNKLIIKIKKEYQHITNIRDNINHHIYSYLTHNHNMICMQDEMIKSWHTTKMFGRTVQFTGMGKLKAKLKNLDASQCMVLPKNVATTKTCIYCGHHHNNVTLASRVITCEKCHRVYDRDVGSSINMILFQIPMEYRDFKPVENLTNVFKNMKTIHTMNISFSSLNQEASPFRVG